MQILWTTAFVTGFVGSLHCVGMCGPIALALPVGGMSSGKVFLSRIFYNLGRITTYSIIGLLMGFLGRSIFFSGLQQEISITIGISLILFLVVSRKVLISKPLRILNESLKKSFSFFFRQKNLLSMFALGVVNGLLPCGFLYLAATGSVVAGSPLGGMLYMALFGLGTAPAMFSVGMMVKFMNFRLRKIINQITPIYTFCLAVFLIIRGLNLGIPFVSPNFEKTLDKQPIPICHQVKNS
jgi:sulfite exporter TauE/SafE